MYHYFKHSILPLVVMPASALLVLLAPGWGFMTAVVITLAHLVVDNLTPPDRSSPDYRFPRLLNAFVYLYFPAALVCLFSLFWLITPGDPLHFGAWADRALGMAILQSKSDSGWPQWLSAAFGIGFVMSANTLVAHELVHRTHDKVAMLIGRWLLAMVGDAQFSISHVYGHHLNVGTGNDAATARRGESLYRFFIRSAIGQYGEALQLEARRLNAQGKPALHVTNRVLTGALMTALPASLFAMYAGWVGVACYALVLFTSKFLFETVNYIEHYGVVRVPGTHVMPRHSWDCDTRAASNILMNLSRHSHHHADAQKEYWELRVQPGGLQLNYGYIGHIILAAVPPLWIRFAAARLREWDLHSATAEERELARAANRKSRHPLFLIASH